SFLFLDLCLQSYIIFLYTTFFRSLAYVGLSFEDLTAWATVGDLIQQAYSNPYLLGLVIVSVFNTITDPTVGGVSDSSLALSYAIDRKSTRLNSSHVSISYAVFCLK